ncbi:hypothetical protein RM590_31355 [Streptomyces sp. DSM 44938]|uniref:DUF2892 domain-containing protein n=1 Tax=Streptomyces litchfieldiae TaxID=3075543 RepID=A0ABU2MZG4_9ACTN|nr:hypothetical protein [Streptomyces sp. DSM 44938]MDT0347047.1 hypothetical protein [Streptomyces sp. DSM 44938]
MKNPVVRSGRSFASRSVPVHLARGIVGFGLLAGSVALVPDLGLGGLLLLPAGVVALRGCPACWVIGLAQTMSRGRLERSCADGGCRVGLRGSGGSVSVGRLESSPSHGDS